MELITALFVTPFASIWGNPEFVPEVIIGGLLSGVMYSLVALGFVLIFKASGVFNFAQGTMVLFAALTFVGLIEHGLPVWGAYIAATVVMVAIAFAVERAMLRPLVNQEPIILFMATIGLSYFWKALPVLMLGGFTSVPGAIVGGHIVGVGEKVAEVFWGPAVGGAIEDWFASGLALVILLFRPQGLFGERMIERV